MRIAWLLVPVVAGSFTSQLGCDLDDIGGGDPLCCTGDPPFPGGAGPQPDFGPLVTQEVAPPPIEGGTLTLVHAGATAIVSDPDRDHIFVVDLSARKLVADVVVDAHAEPGRAAEDAAGRVHVVLRSGSLVTLDPAAWTITATRPVCPAPRGVVYDAAHDAVHVACASGELVTLPAAGGAATRTVMIERDLRDVVIHKGHLVVSKFRSAEALTLDDNGAMISRVHPPAFMGVGNHFGVEFIANGAWRLVVTPDDKLYMLHQRSLDGMVFTSSEGGYGGADPCGDPIVHAAVTDLDDLATPAPILGGAVLPVDLAVSASGGFVTVVSAANAFTAGLPTTITTGRWNLHDDGGGCSGSGSRGASDREQPIAIAYSPDDQLLVQSREPANLVVGSTEIPLSSVSRKDTGHDIFHANAGAGIACASCHLEGGDDNHTWTFAISGPRRTQSLRGGISDTAPFHWDGDQHDFTALMTEVFGSRMAGPPLTGNELGAANHWIDTIPTVPHAAGDTDAIARGKVLFEDLNVGCATCHNGPHLTNNQSFDVGTGGLFQVPRLVDVSEHPPFLHDGRAATLTDRFTPGIGGGDRHGHTRALAAGQIADLVAYLGSL